MSAKKAQLCQIEVTYLRYIFERWWWGGGRWQSKAKIETTLRVSKPSNC